MQTVKSSQYKLRYQYRHYHFTDNQLQHSAPATSHEDHIFHIRRSLSDLCLALTFHVSLGISARKTAYILSNVFEKSTSYQTVLNYANYTAPFCHRFNLKFKEPADTSQVGDETYIKIKGKHNFVFFFVTPSNRAITAYHIDDSRDTLPTTIAMKEAIRTAPKDKPLTLISDGNPSYQAGIHFLNKSRKPQAKISNVKVIGLQNLDNISEQFRPFKQIIERLNRTYKFHIRAANGFNCSNGAVVLTTLFVTFYNFIRPHTSLRQKAPIDVPGIQQAPTIQDKWALILLQAFNLI
jgi:transposase-like protein